MPRFFALSPRNNAAAGAQNSDLMLLLQEIAAHDSKSSTARIAASPAIARQKADFGATRQVSTDFYFKEIGHYVYAGDTALHIAAAAYALEIAKTLFANGANVRAKNRRGAEPLHYAVDGGPESPNWNPEAQASMVQWLIDAGADPNSPDRSGVAPLHRAVRTRCAAAVGALLSRGAEPHLRNGSGSTALHLAVQNTGRGGSGSPASREQQREIIQLLLKSGASPGDRDAHGKSVKDSVRVDWVLQLFDE